MEWLLVIFGMLTIWRWMDLRHQGHATGNAALQHRVAVLEEEVEELRRLLTDAILEEHDDERYQSLRKQAERLSQRVDAS